MKDAVVANMNIYSLFDNVSLTYEGLYLFPNDETAIRGFRHSIPQIPFSEDKDIIFLGCIDTRSGVIGFDFDSITSIGRLVPEVIDDK